MTAKPIASASLAPIALFVVSQVITAAGVYAAIRADLREALVRVGQVERRVDRIEDRRP
jgi:hypothetical protein